MKIFGKRDHIGDLALSIGIASVSAVERMPLPPDDLPMVLPSISVATFLLQFCERRLFVEGGSQVRDRVIDDLVTRSIKALHTNWDELLPYPMPVSMDDLLNGYNLKAPRYATCREMYYDNALIRPDKSSGLWQLWLDLHEEDAKLPSVQDWMKFVTLAIGLLDACSMGPRIEAILKR